MQAFLPYTVLLSLLLPLFSGVSIGLFCQREITAVRISVGVMLLSTLAALVSLVLFYLGNAAFHDVFLFSWITIGDFSCDMGLS